MALDWVSRHSLPMGQLVDPRVIRRALDALALRLNGSRAAANTITRKRVIFRNALSNAVELGLLDTNPLDKVQWTVPRSAPSAGRHAVLTPAQAHAILAEVSRIRPQLTAFFGCLYYAALRPEEAVALDRGSCQLPATGWGQLIISTTAPRTAACGVPEVGRASELR